MQLSDAQLLTACMAIIIPVSLLMYSNSRIGDAKETLRAEIQAAKLELLAEIRSQGEKVDRALVRMDTEVKLHILEFHK